LPLGNAAFRGLRLPGLAALQNLLSWLVAGSAPGTFAAACFECGTWQACRATLALSFLQNEAVSNATAEEEMSRFAPCATVFLRSSGATLRSFLFARFF